MSLLIDPPLWPAHGTLFSHLVSDTSVDELQAFARAAGLPERAFDRDHYDVPQREFERLVGLGAIPTTAGGLTRALIAGGVRVPARDRADRHDKWLRSNFDSLLPDQAVLRETVLDRWAEPHRHYHDRRHLADVLRGVDWLAAQEPTAPRSPGASRPANSPQPSSSPHGSRPTPTRISAADIARLAAWWHDAVYEGNAGADEEASAALAEGDLARAVEPSTVARVSGLILMTKDHAASEDPAAALLSDADLRVLARTEAAYDRYVAAVRQDYAHVPDADFRVGRAAVLRQLLSSDRLYVTSAGHQAWERAARANMERELGALTEG